MKTLFHLSKDFLKIQKAQNAKTPHEAHAERTITIHRRI